MKKAQDSGKPFVDRKQTAAITDDEISGAVIEGISNMASSSHNKCVCRRGKTKARQPSQQMEEALFIRARASVSASRKRCILGPL